MRLAASSGPSAYLTSTSARDVDLRTAIGFDKPATGGGVYAVRGRPPGRARRTTG